MIFYMAGVLAGAVVFGTIIIAINKFCFDRYKYEPFSLLSTIWVGIAFFAVFFGAVQLPEGFEHHQEPMTAVEIEQAKQQIASDLAVAQQTAKTAADPVDKKDAVAEVKRLSALKAPTTKWVWTPGNFRQFLQWPIPGSLKPSFYCLTFGLSIFLALFINNGLKTNWLIAAVTMIVQIIVSVASVVLALMLIGRYRTRNAPISGY